MNKKYRLKKDISTFDVQAKAGCIGYERIDPLDRGSHLDPKVWFDGGRFYYMQSTIKKWPEWFEEVTDEAFQVLNPGLVNPENYSTVPGPVLEITNCQQCPHFKRERYFTGDSWEEAYNWFCKAKKDKKIAGYVEWNEADKIEIPNWCPIIKNQKT